ncbi:MAG: SAM-dependent methyltransferase, partial [Desulfatiglandales bacterium]
MRKRLDLLLVERGLAETREKAKAMILAGHVLICGEVASKAGHLLDPLIDIQIKETPKYVSRGGQKLEAALKAFGIDPQGKTVIDVGASTGGFTDCLLQWGAERV